MTNEKYLQALKRVNPSLTDKERLSLLKPIQPSKLWPGTGIGKVMAQRKKTELWTTG